MASYPHGDKVVWQYGGQVARPQSLSRLPPKQQMIIDAGEAFLAELHPGVKFNVFMAIDNPCDYYRLRYKRADGLALSSGDRVGEIASWPTTATEAEIAGYLTAAMHTQMAKKQVGPERTEQPENGNTLATYEGGGDW